MVKCIVMEMDVSNYPTADNARAVSCNWQKNEVDRLVRMTVNTILGEAHKGQRKAYICTGSSNDGINRDLYVVAMESLGYKMSSRNGTSFWWEW